MKLKLKWHLPKWLKSSLETEDRTLRLDEKTDLELRALHTDLVALVFDRRNAMDVPRSSNRWNLVWDILWCIGKIQHMSPIERLVLGAE